jgi:Uma2 family endonuclease
MSILSTPTVSPDDSALFSGDRSFELVNGELVERHMNMWSSYLGGRLFSRLDRFCETKGLGWALPAETAYQCFSFDPDKVRRPDVSFIKRDRCSEEQARQRGHIRIVPDLIVEVASPHDLADELNARADDFLRAGASLAWIVYPNSERISVLRRDQAGVILGRGDELSGEDVLPGFRLPVADLFVAPRA